MRQGHNLLALLSIRFSTTRVVDEFGQDVSAVEPHDQISLNDGMQALCNPRVPFSQGLSGR